MWEFILFLQSCGTFIALASKRLSILVFCLWVHMVSQHRRPISACSLPWEPQIIHPRDFVAQHVVFCRTKIKNHWILKKWWINLKIKEGFGYIVRSHSFIYRREFGTVFQGFSLTDYLFVFFYISYLMMCSSPFRPWFHIITC
jgi:hypothetical protein